MATTKKSYEETKTVTWAGSIGTVVVMCDAAVEYIKVVLNIRIKEQTMEQAKLDRPIKNLKQTILSFGWTHVSRLPTT